ncbi:unnamed protein product [Mytilus edulis]|uniref:Helitron helicase-like domain-containing protein n=1 Tax=Mytilus edulis TaxID=6550 RepID=A0A8S3RKW8_MYTED|nr:unnamed protein product [Mytilus edulis]
MDFSWIRFQKNYKNLSELESVLLSQRILFYKLLNLPRGGQKGFKGKLVNVPVILSKVTSALPRTPTEAGIIPVKLKRKLQYKGHHIHQTIQPQAIRHGLSWLKRHNKYYTNVQIDETWEQRSRDEEEELWETLQETHSDNDHDNTHVKNSYNDHDDTQVEKSANENYLNTNNQDHEMNENDEIQHPNSDEENVQNKVLGIQYDTCLHPSNIMHTGVESYSIAPGENEIPTPLFMDKQCEALAFPTCFPYGKRNFFRHSTFNGNGKLSLKKYFVTRLTNVDTRFATNMSYIFYALCATEKKQVDDAISIAVRKARKQDITAGQLKDPGRLKEIIVKDQAFQLLQQVRGSPSYWQHAQFKLLALVRSKGPFTWFLTLSCADTKWPETVQSIAAQKGRIISDEEVKNMSSGEKKIEDPDKNRVDELLQHAGITSDIYHQCLSLSKCKTVVLKRTPAERNINYYNPDILHLWEANMDLQFVCDAYACISYIVAYVTKDEKEMSKMLKLAASEMRNADVKTRLKHIGYVFLGNREISAQEAAYRLLGIPLK